MKTRKLKLNDVKIQSFVTKLENSESNTIVGAAAGLSLFFVCTGVLNADCKANPASGPNGGPCSQVYVSGCVD